MHIAIVILSWAIALVSAPLFLDLALCVAGYLLPAPRGLSSFRRAIHLAVVVPAHNEEQLIARTVGSIRAAGPDTPIFVVAHNCSDKTAALASAAGARAVELNDREQRGKGAALRAGFAAALNSGANAVMVVDADSLVSANLIAATQAALEAAAEVTQCRYEMEPYRRSGRALLARLRALGVRGINVVRARGRAGWGLSAGLFGNGFALTAALLERVPLAVDGIAEDVEYHLRLASVGVRVHSIGEAHVHAQFASAGSGPGATAGSLGRRTRRPGLSTRGRFICRRFQRPLERPGDASRRCQPAFGSRRSRPHCGCVAACTLAAHLRRCLCCRCFSLCG